MSDAEFRELVEDIREHGQREPVWILEDKRVIDGKHRVKACVELGRSVEARVYHGSETSVEAFVVSLNLKRRHLNDSQRAMVGNRLANLKEGRPEKTALIQAVSQSDAAEQMKVSRFSIQRAAVVQRDGAPELIAAVDAGQVSVSAAAEVATLPEDEQREVVAAGPDAVKNAAKAVREGKPFVPRDPLGAPVEVEPFEPQSAALLQLKRDWKRARKADKLAFYDWAGEQLGKTPKAKLQ
jgi:ParB-like chromosome segregation protein Spo0J